MFIYNMYISLHYMCQLVLDKFSSISTRAQANYSNDTKNWTQFHSLSRWSWFQLQLHKMQDQICLFNIMELER